MRHERGAELGRTFAVLFIVVCLSIVLVEDVGGNIGGLVRENHCRTRRAEAKDKS